jgi:hypothetical protein
MLSPGHSQFGMIIRSGRVSMDNSLEDAGQLKNLRFRVVPRNSNSLDYLSSGLHYKFNVICSGDRGRGSNPAPDTTTAISINARGIVSQTFGITI